VTQEQRAEVLASLAIVDFITIFDESDPLLALISAIKPDILVKGADWKEKKDCRSRCCKGIWRQGGAS